jgi:spermidine synthase
LQPWRILDRVETAEGTLELRQRGERTCLITIAGRVLMTSDAHRSEDALARLACAPVAGLPRPRVLIGGLGMGYTLRAALDALPAEARVTLVDLNRVVVDWCRGPIAALSGHALDDPRVHVVVADVARVIARAAPGAYDAIALDLYEGPHEATGRGAVSLYGRAALDRARAALAPGGLLAVWSEEPDAPFADRLAAAGFAVERHRIGRGGRTHTVYVGAVRAAGDRAGQGRPRAARPRRG